MKKLFFVILPYSCLFSMEDPGKAEEELRKEIERSQAQELAEKKSISRQKITYRPGEMGKILTQGQKKLEDQTFLDLLPEYMRKDIYTYVSSMPYAIEEWFKALFAQKIKNLQLLDEIQIKKMDISSDGTYLIIWKEVFLQEVNDELFKGVFFEVDQQGLLQKKIATPMMTISSFADEYNNYARLSPQERYVIYRDPIKDAYRVRNIETGKLVGFANKKMGPIFNVFFNQTDTQAVVLTDTIIGSKKKFKKNERENVLAIYDTSSIKWSQIKDLGVDLLHINQNLNLEDIRITYSPLGTYAIVYENNQPIALYNADTWENLDIGGILKDATNISFTPQDDIIMVRYGGDSRLADTAQVYTMQDFSTVISFDNTIQKAQFSRDGRYAIIKTDTSTQVYNAKSWRLEKDLGQTIEGLSSDSDLIWGEISISTSGKYLVAKKVNKIVIYATDTWDTIRQIDSNSVIGVDFSFDNNHAIVTYRDVNDNEFKYFINTSTWKKIFNFGKIRFMQFSPRQNTVWFTKDKWIWRFDLDVERIERWNDFKEMWIQLNQEQKELIERIYKEQMFKKKQQNFVRSEFNQEEFEIYQTLPKQLQKELKNLVELPSFKKKFMQFLKK